MPAPFRKGDIVEYEVNITDSHHLLKGNLYTIEKCYTFNNQWYVTLRGAGYGNNISFYATHFKLCTEELTPTIRKLRTLERRFKERPHV